MREARLKSSVRRSLDFGGFDGARGGVPGHTAVVVDFGKERVRRLGLAFCEHATEWQSCSQKGHALSLPVRCCCGTDTKLAAALRK
ncbi:MAG: hypothetical protein QOC99_3257 [Acidobacteriota bacterium]|nr:hypothetical protein [Acidobacteriota bacterium]